MEDCLFCKIAAGEIPSKKLYEDDQVVAFMISPRRRKCIFWSSRKSTSLLLLH